STVAEPLVSAEPTHLAADSRFLEITSEVTGEEARLVRACGGSDARFFCEKGIPVILSRPRVGNLHGRDEWIEIDSMLAYFEICGRYTLERTGCGTELPLA
ncbi:MAG: M20/M25/M40 family metallo-hydrolase, partial [Verrucomicrobiae bacterium]|nr:M20/M25/M40 family metallo-hydrolase [Verrucomicrobiae bacterium]